MFNQCGKNKDLRVMAEEGRGERRREGADGFTEHKVAKRSMKTIVTVAVFRPRNRKIGERNVTGTCVTRSLHHGFCQSREGSWVAPLNQPDPAALESSGLEYSQLVKVYVLPAMESHFHVMVSQLIHKSHSAHSCDLLL